MTSRDKGIAAVIGVTSRERPLSDQTSRDKPNAGNARRSKTTLLAGRRRPIRGLGEADGKADAATAQGSNSRLRMAPGAARISPCRTSIGALFILRRTSPSAAVCPPRRVRRASASTSSDVCLTRAGRGRDGRGRFDVKASEGG
jgi:hypothetical protein